MYQLQLNHSYFPAQAGKTLLSRSIGDDLRMAAQSAPDRIALIAYNAEGVLAGSGHSSLTLRLNPPTLPYATKAAQFIQSQLSAVGIKVEVQELQFPTQWSDTVMKNGDYDLTIVAHVEPRDMKAVFGNPDYYTHYGTAEIQALFKAADEGTAEDQVTNLKKAARLLSEDAAGDVLFLLPNLMVADKGITGLPKNAIAVAFDLSKLAKGGVAVRRTMT